MPWSLFRRRRSLPCKWWCYRGKCRTGGSCRRIRPCIGQRHHRRRAPSQGCPSRRCMSRPTPPLCRTRIAHHIGCCNRCRERSIRRGTPYHWRSLCCRLAGHRHPRQQVRPVSLTRPRPGSSTSHRYCRDLRRPGNRPTHRSLVFPPIRRPCWPRPSQSWTARRRLPCPPWGHMYQWSGQLVSSTYTDWDSSYRCCT